MLADAKKPLNPAAASAAAPPSVSKPEPNEHPGLAPGSSANTSVANALKGVEFIAQHIKDEDRDNEVSRHFDILSCLCGRRVFTALFWIRLLSKDNFLPSKSAPDDTVVRWRVPRTTTIIINFGAERWIRKI